VARMTRRTRLSSVVVFAIALLLCGLVSASASARVAGAAAPAVTEAKPKVTVQPASVIVEEGQSAVFEAAASGVPAPTVQWEISTNGANSWSPVAGANEDRFTIASAKTSENGDDYRAVFSNSGGSATSKTVTLIVRNAPKVTLQPNNVTVEEGQHAVFEAAASGFPTPSTQWEVSIDGGSTWKKILPATSDQLTVTSTQASANGNEYRAAFSNLAGEAITRVVTLTVQRLPAVTHQPTSATVEAGQSAAFEAAASGFPTPTVQWEVSSDDGGSWSPVPGASEDRLAIASAQTSENGDEYRVVFSNSAGSTTTAVVTLTVRDVPVVTEQPVGLTIELGQSAVFEASASGFPSPTVQWEVSSNGGGSWSPIAGATADRLTIEDAQVSVNGDEYRAAFSNAAGKTFSEAATLTVATHHYRVLDWGQDSFGQLGVGSFAQHDTPVAAIGLNFVTAVAAGNRHSLALLSNDTVVAWGANASGQLGDDSESGSSVPVAVEDLTNVKAIAAGSDYSLALLEDGTVMAWGGNESGQLGDGTFADTELPVAVKGLTDVTAIAAGGEHSLALLSDGQVMAWGQDESGELGNGGDKNSDVPVAVKDLGGVTAIAAGGEHSLALLAGGTVMAWGDDEYGQLGNSSVEEREHEEIEVRRSEVPVAVEGLSGVTAVAAGQHDSLALLANQTVMAWGEDESGELGDGSIVRREETPVAVSGLAGVTAIAAGGEHSLALLANGSVATWGENKSGELGNGSSGAPSDTPVLVSDLAEVKGIAAGGAHDIVYSEPPPSITSVNPTSGPAAGGTSVKITGANLEGATSVAFGATSTTHFTIDSASTITATAPAGAIGTVDVTVTTPAGTSPTSASDRFTYLPPPSVKKVTAKSGPGDGGTMVTITGANLEGATSVSFGAISTSEITAISAKSITVVTPAGAGTVPVAVTTPGGTSAPSSKAQFEFTPLIEGIEPDSGPASGGTRVTISGAGFALGAGATTFKFGSKPAIEVDCTSATSCTVSAPAGKAGGVEVTAAVGKGKSSADPTEDRFTYE
jgi:alpha-tubulin suppressor-like RCC1 family protein